LLQGQGGIHEEVEFIPSGGSSSSTSHISLANIRHTPCRKCVYTSLVPTRIYLNGTLPNHVDKLLAPVGAGLDVVGGGTRIGHTARNEPSLLIESFESATYKGKTEIKKQKAHRRAPKWGPGDYETSPSPGFTSKRLVGDGD
jgi:hypothetical protein